MKNSLTCIGKKEILVPIDYDHNTYISKFKENFYKIRKTKTVSWGFCGASGSTEVTNFVDSIHRDITDENFKEVEDKLIPGKRYLIISFQVTVNNLPKEDVIAFLKKKKALFVGMQGLMLAYELTESYIVPYKRDLVGPSAFSFENKKKNVNCEKRGIPCLWRWAKSSDNFDLRECDEKFSYGDEILYFTEKG